ncbi:MAG: PilZ domain-containing protein [Thermodesulfobacteriota bacterium]
MPHIRVKSGQETATPSTGASMGQKDHLGDQRAEPRFPLHFYASLVSSRNGVHSLSGQIKNISQHGIMLKVPHPLAEHENVQVSFHVPQLRDVVQAQGIVKWCRKNLENYSLGIRFFRSTTFSIPFHHMCTAFEAILANGADLYTSQAVPQNGNQLTYFHDELYYGLFLSMFKKNIHQDLVKLAFYLDVISFYLQNIAAGLEKLEAHHLLTRHIQEALLKSDSLQQSSGDMLHLLEKSKREEALALAPEEHIHIDQILARCIDTFAIHIENLTSKDNITYTVYDAPRVVGCRLKYIKCIECLILFSYQCLFIRKAQGIHIGLHTSKEHVLIDFINDGSQMLQEKCVELHSSSGFDVSAFHLKDRKHLLWLWYALSILQPASASLCIQSESGNNVLKLQIPF